MPASEKIVPRQFVEDFETVATHYGLKHIGEYLIAKDAARNDMENAQATYAALAEEVRAKDSRIDGTKSKTQRNG